MKYVWAVFAACALLAGSALAQQYPAPNQGAYPPADQQSPNQGTYPAQSYPQSGPVYQGNMPANVLPAGTNISIRTNQEIAADKNSTGQSYSAEISQNVTGPNGQVLIPQGSPAMLTVVSVNSGTLGVGSNQVALALQSINFNGRTYQVQAANQTQSGNQGIGANKRTAVMTGGGALLGTIIGAAVGGGKGAAIGAVLGAGGGATAQVLTRGSEVKVPAESVLTFQLDQPLTLQ